MKSAHRLAEMAERGMPGRLWYHEAHVTVRHMSRTHGVPDQRAADIIALFSPRVSVTRNLRMADIYLGDGIFTHDTTRATRAAVVHYEETGVIRGPKTSNFARALMLDETAIVLDVWMARALLVNQRIFGTVSGYAKASARLLRVAGLLSLPPAQVQAAIWHATVLDHGRNPVSLTSR